MSAIAQRLMLSEALNGWRFRFLNPRNNPFANGRYFR